MNSAIALIARIFHLDFGDQMQVINLTKNLAMAGGLLLLYVYAAGASNVGAKRT